MFKLGEGQNLCGKELFQQVSDSSIDLKQKTI